MTTVTLTKEEAELVAQHLADQIAAELPANGSTSSSIEDAWPVYSPQFVERYLAEHPEHGVRAARARRAELDRLCSALVKITDAVFEAETSDRPITVRFTKAETTAVGTYLRDHLGSFLPADISLNVLEAWSAQEPDFVAQHIAAHPDEPEHSAVYLKRDLSHIASVLGKLEPDLCTRGAITPAKAPTVKPLPDFATHSENLPADFQAYLRDPNAIIHFVTWISGSFNGQVVSSALAKSKSEGIRDDDSLAQQIIQHALWMAGDTLRGACAQSSWDKYGSSSPTATDATVQSLRSQLRESEKGFKTLHAALLFAGRSLTVDQRASLVDYMNAELDVEIVEDEDMASARRLLNEIEIEE